LILQPSWTHKRVNLRVTVTKPGQRPAWKQFWLGFVGPYGSWTTTPQVSCWPVSGTTGTGEAGKDGGPRIGSTVRVVPPLAEAGTTITYRWFVAAHTNAKGKVNNWGRLVPLMVKSGGAAKSSYTVDGKWKGYQLSVVVMIQKPGTMPVARLLKFGRIR
jgi:hypothetical protein